MSSIVKKHLLGRLSVEGEYVIDPEQVSRSEKRRPQVDKNASPEDIARSIIAEAEESSASLISSAREEAEEIKKSAYVDGYEAGLSSLQEEKDALQQRIAEIESNAERRVEEFWVTIEPELLKLSIDIAGKIIHRDISEQDDFVLNTVKAALYQLRDRQELKIRVNPVDYDFVREHKEEIASSCDGVRSIEVIEDRRIGRGGSLIESGNGHLDARIDTQLHEVERALMEAAHDARHDTAA